MKKNLISLSVILVILILTGCQKPKMKVGILVYEEQDTFIAELVSDITTHMPDDVWYQIVYASNSQSVQNQQLLKFIKEDVDLLLVNAVDRLAGSAIVEKSQQAGIPIIFFNREPLASDLEGAQYTYYVGADADDLGVKQAEIVNALYRNPNQLNNRYDKNRDGKIQMVIIKGQQGHQDAEKRTQNNIGRLQELGYQVELLSTRVANWQRQESYEVMEELYETFGDQIELVLANNDDMALGAIDYFLDVNIFEPNASLVFNQPIVIIGVDGTEAGLDAIRNGLMYGTVLNDAKKQSEAIIELIDYMLMKKDMDQFPFVIENEHFIYIEGKIILKENI